MDKDRNSNSIQIGGIMALAVMPLICLWGYCFGQAETPPKAYAVQFSPDPEWFECGPCEDALEYMQIRNIKVRVVKIPSRKVVNEMGLKGFPTIIIGREVVGFDKNKLRRATE